jgi:FlaA1/EpsC-like NDP-sugar epimerase
MTVAEAVELVIQAGAIGTDGEVLILDMGEPVKIADVAERLVSAAERRIDIVYTGLRPGEKLHEVLTADYEVDYRPIHPLISHAQVPPVDLIEGRRIPANRSVAELIDGLRELALSDAPVAPSGPTIDLVAAERSSEPAA